MLKDRYDLALTTASAAARDAYVQASGLALTFYPGAVEAYDRAIAADPGFALAHAGKAQVLMREGDVAAARAALAAAKGLASGVSEREAESHRDTSTRVRRPDRRRDRRLASPSDGVAARRAGARQCGEPQRPDRRLRPHRPEAPDRGTDGQPRPALRRRFLVPVLSCHGPVRGWAARAGPGEDRAVGGGEPEKRAWRARLRAYLLRERRPRRRAAAFSRRGSPPIRGTAFSTAISAGISRCSRSRPATGRRRCGSIATPSRSTGTAAGRNRKCPMAPPFCGGPSSPASRATPRPGARCTTTPTSALPRPGNGLYDLHVILAQAVMGDEAALDARARQIEELAREGRYLSGSYLPALARGFSAFEREDFSAAIEALAPLAGGKRAHWRQPCPARPDRVHVAKRLPRRQPAGGGAASARRAAAGRFRHSRRGPCSATVSAKLSLFAIRSGCSPAPST